MREALELHQASEYRWIMTSFYNICLFEHKIPELSASASLTINCRKTKILSLTRNANGLVQVGGEQIEAVDKFTYKYLTYLVKWMQAAVQIWTLRAELKKPDQLLVFCSCLVQSESGHWPKTVAI